MRRGERGVSDRRRALVLRIASGGQLRPKRVRRVAIGRPITRIPVTPDDIVALLEGDGKG